MHRLAIDYETFSTPNIKEVGLYKYVESMDFEIMLASYKLNDLPTVCTDLYSRQKLPAWFMSALTDPNYLKTSHNAPFEIESTERFFGIKLDNSQWECTMTKAAYMGWPLALDAVSKAMKLPVEKMSEGKRLISFFCSPVKPTKANGYKTRNFPEDFPEKWEKFKKYNITDVDVESMVYNYVKEYTLPLKEKKIWALDQVINKRGVAINMLLVDNVMKIDQVHKASLVDEARKLTGMANPNSPAQIKEWLKENGVEVDSLKKEELEETIKGLDMDPDAKRMLELRGDMSKTSISKYQRISMAVCEDGRLRGLFQYYGANRTGRFAGRLTQVHNLVRNDLDSDSDPDALDRARNIVLNGSLSVEDKIYLLGVLYGSVPDVLSKLIRTVFIASEGNELLISDLASIEARILAWLADERWKLEVFRTHGKIYEATASQMFKVPMSAVTKSSEFRRKAKISELAFGYNGGPDAAIKMGAIKMGMIESELPKIVRMWRNANPMICKLWTTVNDAAIEAITNPGKLIKIAKGVSIICKNGYMFIYLPSGRSLHYVRPRLCTNRFEGVGIGYDGMNQTTKVWGQQQTYGGKLVENIVQAIARDVLTEGMLMLDEPRGLFPIVLHVHDEVAIDNYFDKSKRNKASADAAVDAVNCILKANISWAPGLPLGAEGFSNSYYKKD